MNNDFVRSVCLACKATTEDVKWGDNLCFLVANKIYCMADTGGTFGVSLKCTEEDFALLTERDGLIQAPYMAKRKWIKAEEPACLTKIEWEQYIRKSYELVLAKLPLRQKAEFGL